MLTNKLCLTQCLNPLNCVFFQKEFEDVDMVFTQLVKIAQLIRRTNVLESNDFYWKGVCRSLIFRYPDDLEIQNSAK